MVALSAHPIRPLSPITELTTPTSLRTLQLPLEEADYHSERRTSYEEDDASVYSRESADTVREGVHNREEAASTPTRHRTVSLPGPRPPPRSPKRAIPPSASRWGSTTSLLQQHADADDKDLPFPPRSTPLPGGLLPPPRSASTNKPKLIKRVTPPPSPRPGPFLDDDVRKRLTEAFGPNARSESPELSVEITGSEVDEGNMAGVGAGRSLASSYSEPSRPNSIQAVTSNIIPGSITSSPNDGSASSTAILAAKKPTQQDHPALHNIPFLDPPPKKKSSPRSRPNSLKKRPKSYHGSRPGSMSSRPNSFHGSLPKEHAGKDPTPTLGLEMDLGVRDDSTAPMNASGLSPSVIPRPTLTSRQSESSLPTQSNTARSSSPSGRSPRRRRVSSIFSSIFGSSSPVSEHVSRKLSKKSRAGTSGTSRDSAPPSPTSPAGFVESPVGEEPIGPLQSAIRTSGTFGIRDDGSDISKVAQSPGSHKPDYKRTGSGSGSVITHSDGVKRILYVENAVPTPASVERRSSDDPEAFYTPSEMPIASTVPDHAATTSFVTPPQVPFVVHPDHIDSGGRPGSVPEAPYVLNAPPELPHRQSFPPHLPAVGISYSSNHNLKNDHYGLGAWFQYHPTNGTPLPSLLLPAPPAQVSPVIPLPQAVPNGHLMIDESVQTSVQSSPSKTPRSRPLPRPPSRATSPLRTPEPTCVPPGRSDTSPPNDLPLLIASHLLSTHAAALMRHSSSMNEASETMRRMARESLDWGGVLMRMTDKGVRPPALVDGIPRTAGGDGAGYEGIPLPRTSSSSRTDMARAGTLSSPLLSPPREGYDPIRAAYDNLTSLPPRPSVSRNLAREERRRKADSLPADLLKEAQRLGDEGWRSLHAAEEAWAGAMGRLSEMLARPDLAEGAEDKDSKESAEVRSTSPSAPRSADSHGSAVAHPRHPAFTPLTTLSFPMTSPTPYSPPYLSSGSAGMGPDQSFVPDERDMLSPSSATATIESHLSYPQPRSGISPGPHPYSQANPDRVNCEAHEPEREVGVTIREALNMPLPIPMVRGCEVIGQISRDGDRYENGEKTIRARHVSVPVPMIRPDHPFTQHLPADLRSPPAPAQSQYHAPNQVHAHAQGQGQSHVTQGYTNESLGFSSSPIPMERQRVESPLRSGGSNDRDRDRATPSRSTMSSSVGFANESGSRTGKVGSNKLAKKHKLRRPSVSASGLFRPENGNNNHNGVGEEGQRGDGADTVARREKKLWWGAKKE